MIGLIDRDLSSDLNSDEKEVNYEQARAPVRSLYKEIAELRNKIDEIIDKDSKEFKTLVNKKKKLEKELRIAEENAAQDIFERNNSFGNMGISKNDNSNSISIDFHGLHVKDAKRIFKETVLPVLPVLRHISIITGHGTHNIEKQSTLKESLKKFISEELKLKCIEAEDNPGMLKVNT